MLPSKSDEDSAQSDNDNWDDWDDIDCALTLSRTFVVLDDGVDLVSLEDAYDADFDEYVDPDSLDDEFDNAYDDEFGERLLPVRLHTPAKKAKTTAFNFRTCKLIYLHRVSILARISMPFIRFQF